MKKPLVKDRANSLSSSLRLNSAAGQGNRSATKTTHFEIRATRDFPGSRPVKNKRDDDARYLLGYN